MDRTIIRVEALAELVHPNLLEVPDDAIRDSIYHGAANEIDEALFRLRVAREIAPAWTALLLARMEEGSLHFALGRSNLRDYAREELGLTPHQVTYSLKLGRAFERYPLLFDLVLEGRMTSAQVHALLRVVRDEAELSEWVEKAESLGGVELLAQVEEEDARRQEAAPGGDASRPVPLDALSFSAPPEFLARWQLTLELCRKLEGARTGPSRMAGMLAAEWLSSHGAPEEPGAEQEAFARETQSRAEAAAEALRICRALEVETERWSYLSWQRPSFALPEAADRELRDETRDPHAVHRRLVYLGKLARGIDARMARLLWTFRRLGRVRRMMFLSFDHYVKERLRMSPSLASELIRVDKQSFLRAPVGEAWFAGEVTWYQVRQLIRLPEWSPAYRPWLERAKSTTVARLQEEIDGVLLEYRKPGLTTDAGTYPPADPDAPAAEQAPDANAKLLDPASVLTSGRVQVFLGGEGDAVAEVKLALRSVRVTLDRPDLETWQCFDELMHNFWKVHGKVYIDGFRNDQRIYRRDRFRCRMPGCRNLASGLHKHHILFRSLGGGDEDDNLLVVCNLCHARVIHAGYARIAGRVSEGLTFELGTRAGAPPLSVWRGERRAERCREVDLAGSGCGP